MRTIKQLTSIKEISALEKLGVEIEFQPENEETSPYDMHTEDETAKQVCEDFNNGNAAAWFCAKVTVKYRGHEADDYLGCCSYKSFKEFTSMDNDYYMDMINSCIADINIQVENENADIQKWWDIRRAKNLLSKNNLYVVSSKELHTL